MRSASGPRDSDGDFETGLTAQKLAVVILSVGQVYQHAIGNTTLGARIAEDVLTPEAVVVVLHEISSALVEGEVESTEVVKLVAATSQRSALPFTAAVAPRMEKLSGKPSDVYEPVSSR